MVNAHSHAFQRDLRGRAEGDGDFWTWRDEMYRLATGLDPDGMHDVAKRAYAEMLNAGYGAVGEFHYVHHQPDGTPYDDPNEMAIAVAEAAVEVGIQIVLLPAAYNRGGYDRPPDKGQLRFCDEHVETFLERVDALRDKAAAWPHARVGVAAHSVRAVPAQWLEAIATYADANGLVRHVHAHEQRKELEETQAEHGCTPIDLLHRTGFLGPATSVIHGTHVSDRDVERLAESDTLVVACPTTEGNLGDGFLPAMRYREAGVRLAIGSDSQARIDPFEETRELETIARRESESRRGLIATTPDQDLWREIARNGAASLGLAPNAAGEIELDLDHPDLRGIPTEQLNQALATAASAGVVTRHHPPPH